MSKQKQEIEFKPIVRPIVIGEIGGRLKTSELSSRAQKVLGRDVRLFTYMTPEELYRMGFLEAARKLSNGAINNQSYSDWEDTIEDLDDEEDSYVPRFKGEA